MELSEKLEKKLSDLMTVWADEYLEDNPVMFGTALYYGIKREIEKATEAVKEIK
jgi:hypothetical protein